MDRRLVGDFIIDWKLGQFFNIGRLLLAAAHRTPPPESYSDLLYIDSSRNVRHPGRLPRVVDALISFPLLFSSSFFSSPRREPFDVSLFSTPSNGRAFFHFITADGSGFIASRN